VLRGAPVDPNVTVLGCTKKPWKNSLPQKISETTNEQAREQTHSTSSARQVYGKPRILTVVPGPAALGEFAVLSAVGQQKKRRATIKLLQTRLIARHLHAMQRVDTATWPKRKLAALDTETMRGHTRLAAMAEG